MKRGCQRPRRITDPRSPAWSGFQAQGAERALVRRYARGIEEMFCLIECDGSQYTGGIRPLTDMPSSNSVSNFRITQIITEKAVSKIRTRFADPHAHPYTHTQTHAHTQTQTARETLAHVHVDVQAELWR